MSRGRTSPALGQLLCGSALSSKGSGYNQAEGAWMQARQDLARIRADSRW